MSLVVSPPSVPSWEDQIVPTLKKRLETESHYISNRLSSSGYQPDRPVSPPNKLDAETRQRTLSTPFAFSPDPSSNIPIPSEPGPSRIPLAIRRPSANSSSSASSSRRPSYNNTPATEPVKPSGIPTLTRPRSKSNISAASLPQASAPVPGVPRRNPSPPKSSAPPLQPSRLHPNANTGKDLRHRKSFELSEKKFPEVYLKNELPPFVLQPEEALEIAQRGHDLQGGDDSVGDGENGKRQRTESMSPPQRVKSIDRGGQGIPGLPKSSTQHSFGLGHPSGHRPTGRSATTGRAAAMPASSAMPRSVTLNLSSSTSSTPSNSRLGVAAHLIPPESAYTPPKGANWDDVVLPSVAKKMNLGEGRRVGADEMEEGDLAVEWDKNGTPVKWVKSTPSSLEKDKGRDAMGQEETPTRSGFSPSFEPSPDNPLGAHSLHAIRSQYPPRPSPEGLSQIKTTSAWDTTPSALFSPAPFSGLPKRPPGSEPAGAVEVKRKPSFLKGASPSVSRQTSQANLRQNGPTMSPGRSMDGRPYGAAGGRPHGIQEERVGAQGAVGPRPPRPDATRGKEEKGTHGGGCGCIIM